MSHALPVEAAPDLGTAVTKSEIARSLAAGVIAGQIAGLIMVGVMATVFTVFLGEGPLYPLQVIGSLLFGDRALSGFRLPSSVAGLVLHQLGPCFFWGGWFGLVTHFFGIHRGSRLLALGIATGVVSQVVDVNLILPVAFQALHGHDIWAERVPAFWSWASHVVFGVGLASFSVVYDYLGAAPSSSLARAR